jgi:hypothetical protein
MTHDRDLDRALDRWMDEGPTVVADRVVAAAMTEIHTTRQRGALLAPLENLIMRMQPIAPLIGVAAAVVVALAIFTALGDRSRVGDPEPTPSPRPTASPDPAATITTAEAFSVPLSLELPSGWEVREAAAFFSAFRPVPQPEQLFERIVFADPRSMRVSEAAGTEPWPDDLHAWLEGRPEFEPSEPVAVSVGGRPATMIEAVATYEPTATRPTLAIVQIGPSNPIGEGTILALSEGSVTWRLIEVDLGDGTQVVIAYLRPTEAFDAWAAEVERILDTVRFE